MKINLELVLNRIASSLAPYFFIWFAAENLFKQSPHVNTWQLAFSAICWAIGLLWFYAQTVGLFHFFKQKILSILNQS
ncbi:hypothetical protein N5580_22295 (plasmid) [Pantoea piersonii]|uniref:Uncharacterized protein n=1 Tax=Pantoea piersonii TaxID=2364647 RepID=A0AAJ5UCK6_9GAMM|nr:hypothetical protein [Pantoea piersonii]WBG93548.1 hypothetical protein N5580_22295 [Pantoea piersonii]